MGCTCTLIHGPSARALRSGPGVLGRGERGLCRMSRHCRVPIQTQHAYVAHDEHWRGRALRQRGPLGRPVALRGSSSSVRQDDRGRWCPAGLTAAGARAIGHRCSPGAGRTPSWRRVARPVRWSRRAIRWTGYSEGSRGGPWGGSHGRRVRGSDRQHSPPVTAGTETRPASRGSGPATRDS